MRLRGHFIAGLLVSAPIAITLYVTWLAVTFIDAQVVKLLPRDYEAMVDFPLPGLGLIIVLIALVFIGWITKGVMGRLFFRYSERLIAYMPVVRGLYGAIKKIFSTVLQSNSKSFRQVALIEYPRRGLWVIVFISNEVEGAIRNALGEESLCVFLPTTPNPTSGFLLIVPKKDVTIIDMTVEDAFKLVISGGIAFPEHHGESGERMIPPNIAPHHV
ncbi:MAG: DUF502 domain-containing protein [Alphaproteobacteria bacterium GM7ARS4]|nr:DUF502 domain-containing protein [Alphaproteobacteria bacterium GM7ARS4]